MVPGSGAPASKWTVSFPASACRFTELMNDAGKPRDRASTVTVYVPLASETVIVSFAGVPLTFSTPLITVDGGTTVIALVGPVYVPSSSVADVPIVTAPAADAA